MSLYQCYLYGFDVYVFFLFCFVLFFALLVFLFLFFLLFCLKFLLNAWPMNNYSTTAEYHQNYCTPSLNLRNLSGHIFEHLLMHLPQKICQV
uniref:Uncharacterized protein n=1 Tax=Anguilla anguilla TaxID=7936 RepID=A0A0E9X1E3_ANGAN